MRINTDYGERVIIDTARQEWIDSPAQGVQRRMLDREGAETGRATSLVRFAPDSYFPEHSHPGGEEFLVLEGTFSDETGDFHTGMYVRNPVGSAHRPHTKDGCIIFVKLCQMAPDDQEFVRVDTKASDGWADGPVPGVMVKHLHAFEGEEVSLQKWQAGAVSDDQAYPGGIELLVLEGSLEDADGHYTAGSWLRLPPSGRHAPHSPNGCTVYIKTGHLAEYEKTEEAKTA